MGRGRKAEPTPLKILKGTREDRINRDEPQPDKGIPERPRYLDEIAALEWDRIVPQLERMGVLTSIDGAAIALYCDSFSQMVRANEDILLQGMLLENGLDGLKANPAVAMARAAKAQMHRLLTEFGCTPASRSKLRVPRDDKPKDALGDFLTKKAK